MASAGLVENAAGSREGRCFFTIPRGDALPGARKGLPDARQRLPALHSALSDARSFGHQRNAEAGTADSALRGVITELDQLLEDDDPLWHAFGLNAPADPATPGIPDGLVLTAGPAGSGICYADCPDARRGERYVWEIQLAGSTDWTQSGDSTTESDATLTGLPAGVVKVRVRARNTAGDSAPSAEATITLA